MRAGEPLILWDWTFNHVPEIWLRVQEHLLLTGIAVSVGFVLAFALSLAIRQMPILYGPVTWVTGILYTIPSLALFSLLIPFTGLSILTAEIGLVSYTLLILVRNIVGGLRSVPVDVREAAIGMGYSPWQLLWRIELPLAMAVIIAGVRVAEFAWPLQSVITATADPINPEHKNCLFITSPAPDGRGQKLF